MDNRILGSHNSGMYEAETTVAPYQDISESFNHLIACSCFLVGKKVKDWSICQSKTVLEQLKSGVRMLDLRIGYRANKSDFYIVHGLYGPKLSDILSQIKIFMANNYSHVIVQLTLDNTVTGKRHKYLGELIDRYLSIYSGPTGVQIFTDRSIDTKIPCTTITQQTFNTNWYNTSDPKVLKNKILEASRTGKNTEGVLVIQNILTADKNYILKRPTGSIKEMNKGVEEAPIFGFPHVLLRDFV